MTAPSITFEKMNGIPSLSAALESQVPFGTLMAQGIDIEILIDRETRVPKLEEALQMVRAQGDLRWHLRVARRLFDLTQAGKHGLGLIRALLWAHDFASAGHVFSEIEQSEVNPQEFSEIEARLAIGLRDEGRARKALARLPVGNQMHSEIRLNLIAGMMSWGRFESARAELDAVVAELGMSAPIAITDTRLALLEHGPLAALKRLDELSQHLDPEENTYRYLKLDFLIERGRHNEALDLALGWLEEDPLAEALYAPAARAARDADRGGEFGDFLERTSAKYPSFSALTKALCSHAIENGDRTAAENTLRQIRGESTWTWMLLRFADACQRPLDRDVDGFFRMLKADGIHFFGPTIIYAHFLYYFRTGRKALERANGLVEEILGAGMDNPGLVALHLRLLIALDRDDVARTVYEQLPAGLRAVAEIAPFEMYFLARAGEDDAARWGWSRYLTDTAHMALNARSSYPEEVEIRFDGQLGQILSFTTVFNGIEYVEWFLSYYRRLGVDHFFFVDNGSTDGTFEMLRVQPDVSLLRNTGSFSASGCGVFWLNHVMRRYGVGNWCLHVDIDEALVFPGLDEGRKLAQLLGYFDANGYETTAGMMIDIYPDMLQQEAGKNPFQASRYIDNDYVWMRNEVPPYYFVKGGIRARRTGRSLMMTKAPLIKMRPDTAYIANNHNHTHQRFADITVALLHYKFIGDFNERVDEAVERKEHFQGAHFYRMLQNEFLNTNKPANLASPQSILYKGTKELVSSGVLASSPLWDSYVA